MNRKKKLGWAGLGGIFMALIIAGVALATTISIDGTRESAWDTVGTVSDVNETFITNDGTDLVRVQWTNDTSNYYFLLETATSTDWGTPPFAKYAFLCINTDNDTGTGTTRPAFCSGSGYDRYIYIQGPSSSLTTIVYDKDLVVISSSFPIATSGVYTEFSVPVADLGLSSSNCGSMPAGAYFDGASFEDDDRGK